MTMVDKESESPAVPTQVTTANFGLQKLSHVHFGHVRNIHLYISHVHYLYKFTSANIKIQILVYSSYAMHELSMSDPDPNMVDKVSNYWYFVALYCFLSYKSGI